MEAAPSLSCAAVVAGCAAIPALAFASRPLVAYFFGSSRRTFAVILLVVIAVGGPRLTLSPEVVIDAVTLAVVSVLIAAVSAGAARYALRRQTPDSPEGLDSA
ncbi:hypothetical protein [Clavibacter michiganensis]|uniref:Uncharacterized protein n=1 Tax=Clavibacter michiganensis TaxID=28447 RepID=A0A251YIT4_9MICO|nr:hypothetical protein [Clavibacter michiganensis]OUE24134.1 hypothetical protein BFL37_09510 [Clavibacter michiganensis]